jgi:chromosome segregation ATPase
MYTHNMVYFFKQCVSVCLQNLSCFDNNNNVTVYYYMQQNIVVHRIPMVRKKQKAIRVAPGADGEGPSAPTPQGADGEGPSAPTPQGADGEGPSAQTPQGADGENVITDAGQRDTTLQQTVAILQSQVETLNDKIGTIRHDASCENKKMAGALETITAQMASVSGLFGTFQEEYTKLDSDNSFVMNRLQKTMESLNRGLLHKGMHAWLQKNIKEDNAILTNQCNLKAVENLLKKLKSPQTQDPVDTILTVFDALVQSVKDLERKTDQASNELKMLHDHNAVLTDENERLKKNQVAEQKIHEEELYRSKQFDDVKTLNELIKSLCDKTDTDVIKSLASALATMTVKLESIWTSLHVQTYRARASEKVNESLTESLKSVSETMLTKRGHVIRENSLQSHFARMTHFLDGLKLIKEEHKQRLKTQKTAFMNQIEELEQKVQEAEALTEELTKTVNWQQDQIHKSITAEDAEQRRICAECKLQMALDALKEKHTQNMAKVQEEFKAEINKLKLFYDEQQASIKKERSDHQRTADRLRKKLDDAEKKRTNSVPNVTEEAYTKLKQELESSKTKFDEVSEEIKILKAEYDKAKYESMSFSEQFHDLQQEHNVLTCTNQGKCSLEDLKERRDKVLQNYALAATKYNELIERTLEEQQDCKAEKPQCSICFDKAPDTAISPCGHLVCKECLTQCQQICPHCRTPVKSTLRVYV